VLVEFHKNGSPKTHSDAFQFGVRYSLDGKRKLDTAATLDEALVILKDRNVRLNAQQSGVALPEAAGKRQGRRRFQQLDLKDLDWISDLAHCLFSQAGGKTSCTRGAASLRMIQSYLLRINRPSLAPVKIGGKKWRA
jgi:hypothetical protein